jgi:hypothetical protein
MNFPTPTLDGFNFILSPTTLTQWYLISVKILNEIIKATFDSITC